MSLSLSPCGKSFGAFIDFARYDPGTRTKAAEDRENI